MLNLEYHRMKADKNLVTSEVFEDTLTLRYARFDSETGEQLEAMEQSISLDMLRKQLSRMRENVDIIEKIITSAETSSKESK